MRPLGLLLLTLATLVIGCDAGYAVTLINDTDQPVVVSRAGEGLTSATILPAQSDGSLFEFDTHDIGLVVVHSPTDGCSGPPTCPNRARGEPDTGSRSAI